MENYFELTEEYASAIARRIKNSQHEVKEMQELIGKSCWELEEIYLNHYINYEADNETMELISPTEIIVCKLERTKCIKAHIITEKR